MVETLAVNQALAVVTPERLFVKIPEKMEWLYADICPVEAALQETPEIL